MNFLKTVVYLTVGYFVAHYIVKKINNFNLMKTYHFHLESLKKQLFEEAFMQVNTDSPKLDILEIGIGTGENFKYFPQNSNLIILDKTDMFMPNLKASIIENNRQDLNISKLVLNHAENMHSIKSNSVDAVVHTFILCSVRNSDAVLKEIYRVLKPGGVCVFIEHSIDKEAR